MNRCSKLFEIAVFWFNLAFAIVLRQIAWYISIMKDSDLLARITTNKDIFGGKPIIRNRRLAVEHVLRMLEAGDTEKTLLEAYPWLEAADIQACVLFNEQQHQKFA